MFFIFFALIYLLSLVAIISGTIIALRYRNDPAKRKSAWRIALIGLIALVCLVILHLIFGLGNTGLAAAG